VLGQTHAEIEIVISDNALGRCDAGDWVWGARPVFQGGLRFCGIVGGVYCDIASGSPVYATLGGHGRRLLAARAAAGAARALAPLRDT